MSKRSQQQRRKRDDWDPTGYEQQPVRHIYITNGPVEFRIIDDPVSASDLRNTNPGMSIGQVLSQVEFENWTFNRPN